MSSLALEALAQRRLVDEVVPSVGGFGMLPVRVKVLSSWWHGHGWFSAPHSGHVVGDDRLYVLSPSVPVVDAILVFGELVSDTEAALRGGYSLGNALDMAAARLCHLAIGIPWTPSSGRALL